MSRLDDLFDVLGNEMGKRKMPTEEVKSPASSRTIWFNLVALLVAIATAALNNEWVMTHPRAVLAIGAAVAAGNVILRFLTRQPIIPSREE